MRTVPYEHFEAIYVQSIFTLRSTCGPWWVFSWENLNKLYASIGFPVLELEGFQRANRADWKGLARYFKEQKQLLQIHNMLAIYCNKKISHKCTKSLTTTKIT